MRRVPAVRAAVCPLLVFACVAAVAIQPAPAQSVAAPFPSAPNAVRAPGAAQIPARTKYVAPDYPEAARAAGVRGTVNVEVLVSPAGKVQDARIAKSIPPLDQAALAAVRQWEFEPTLVNGAAVPLVMTLNVTFPPRGPAGARSGGGSGTGTGSGTGGGSAAGGDTGGGAAGRAPGAQAGDPPAPPSAQRSPEDTKAIMLLRSRHDAAAAARAADAIAAFYADDALLMPPGEATVTGRAAIKAWLAKGTLPTPGDITLDLEVMGEVAFCRMEPAAGVRVVWLLARQDDRTWKIASSIWNAMPAKAK